MSTTTVPAGRGEPYFLNMGPQHPSMHGVLRLKLQLLGEEIIGAEAIIGYAHRAQEKMAEGRDYQKFLPQSARLDYLSAMIYNVGYCQAIEKILELEVPERAEYIRVIVCELNRVSSHLLWIAAFLLDIGGITPFLYGWDDREQILDILDRVTGQRLTYTYGRFGGVALDIDDTFIAQTNAFVARLRRRLVDYDKLIRQNVIFVHRCEGVGVISQDMALNYGLTGPTLRSTGIRADLRKDEPYGIYERFDFDIPTTQNGDVLDRYDIRVREMEQSLRIIEQAITGLPDGPVMPAKPKKRFKIPTGEYYFAVESARGVFGMYFVADGSDVPTKLKLRTPSFSNLSSMPELLRNTMIADTIAIVGSIDVVLPEIDR